AGVEYERGRIEDPRAGLFIHENLSVSRDERLEHWKSLRYRGSDGIFPRDALACPIIADTLAGDPMDLQAPFFGVGRKVAKQRAHACSALAADRSRIFKN